MGRHTGEEDQGKWKGFIRESLGLEENGLGKERVTLFALGLAALRFSQRSKSKEGVSKDELENS